jgi:hypothetical protein
VSSWMDTVRRVGWICRWRGVKLDEYGASKWTADMMPRGTYSPPYSPADSAPAEYWKLMTKNNFLTENYDPGHYSDF